MYTFIIKHYSGYEKDQRPHNLYETKVKAATKFDAVWFFQKDRHAMISLKQNIFYKVPVVYSIDML